MNKRFFTIPLEDAELWQHSGLSAEDEDAVILALWRWMRGRQDDSALSTPAKLIYAPIIARWEYNTRIGTARSAAGRRGANARWHNFANDFANGKTDGKTDGKKCPTTTSPSTSPSSSSVMCEGAKPPIPPKLTPEDLLGMKCEKPSRRKFIPPTVEEVRTYCTAQEYATVDPERFVDYYTSNGWRVGKSPMKDWQAAVRAWTRNAAPSAPSVAPVGVILRNQSRKEADYEL